MANRPPKPPSPPRTPARAVALASGLMRSTSSSPASMSTPASRYVMDMARRLLRLRGEAQRFFEGRNQLHARDHQPHGVRVRLLVRAQLVDHRAHGFVEWKTTRSGADGGEGDGLVIEPGGGEQGGSRCLADILHADLHPRLFARRDVDDVRAPQGARIGYHRRTHRD